MSERGRFQSNTSVHEWQVLFDELLREGFSPEEADLALRDAGVLPRSADEHAPAVPPSSWATATSGHGASGHPPTDHPFAGDAGQRSYLLGLLAWLPIPLFSALIAGVAMAAALPGQRRRSPLAGENARRAANWGLTYALGVVLSVVTTAILVLATGEEGPAARDGFPWQLWFLSPILVLGVGHLVVTVVGLSRTSRGEAFRAPGVPFFRAVDLDPEVARLFDARRERASGASV